MVGRTNAGGIVAPDLNESVIAVTSDKGAIITARKGTKKYTKTAGSKLPDAYQEVEYITSSGTQYIDTGFSSRNYNDNSVITIIGSYNEIPSTTSGSTTNAIYGISGYNHWQMMAYYGGDFQLQSGGGNTEIKFTDFTPTDKHVFIIDQLNSKVSVDTDFAFSDMSRMPSENTGSAFLFAMNVSDAPSAYSKFRLYSCKIEYNGNTIKNFIPCYRKSDNTIGLYDTINDNFHINKGSGTFTKGDNVTSYTAEFSVKYSGRWTITAEKSGEETLTKYADVMADNTTYTIDARFWDGSSLYDAGNEYTSITGGWSASGYSDESYTYTQATKNASNFVVTGTNDQVGTALGTIKKIDFTNINTLYIHGSAESSSRSFVFILTTKSVQSKVSQLTITSSGAFTQSISVSSLSGSYYVLVASSSVSNKTTIDKIWLI